MNAEGDISGKAIVLPTERPRTSPPGSRGSEHMPRDPFCKYLPDCKVSRPMKTGGGKNIFKLDS